MDIGMKIVEVARSYLGQQEKPGNKGFKDPVFEKKMREVGFKSGDAWCCYLTELVYKEALGIYIPESYNFLDKLFSASTQKTWNNFKAEGEKYGFKRVQMPTPGALVFWRSAKNSSLGHIAICSSGVTQYQKFNAVEGNTNDVGGREGYIVAEKLRIYDYTNKYSLNLLGFFEFPFQIPSPKEVPYTGPMATESTAIITNYAEKYLNIYSTT